MPFTEPSRGVAVRLLAIGLAAAASVSKPATAPPPAQRASNPAIQLNQVEGPAAASRRAVGVRDVAPRPGRSGVAIAPAQVARPVGPNTRLTQPSAALDRCEAILQGRSPPVDGLDCGAGQLEGLREQAASPPSATPNVDALSRDLLRTPGGGPGDAVPGAPAIVILTPGR